MNPSVSSRKVPVENFVENNIAPTRVIATPEPSRNAGFMQILPVKTLFSISYI
jgi:hypothetical protein